MSITSPIPYLVDHYLLNGENDSILLEINDEAEDHSLLSTESESTSVAELSVELDMEAAADDSEWAALKAKQEAEEAKDRAEAARDAAEAKKDEKEAQADFQILKSIRAAAAAASNSTDKTVIQLPTDPSIASNAETLRLNVEATSVIQGALGEMSTILQSKDETIRSLIANISYLTVNIGKLANQVDLQKQYISLLSNKLELANEKNKQLHNHVELSAATLRAARKGLKNIRTEFDQQDQATTSLSKFLTSNQDNIVLPVLPDNLEVRGKPITSIPAPRRIRARTCRNCRVAADEVVHVVRSSPLVSISVPHTVYRSNAVPFYNRAIRRVHHISTTRTHPRRSSYFAPRYHRNARAIIPTIVLERPDDGTF